MRMEFADDHVLVQDTQQDEKRERPDLVIQGSLPDIVQLASRPLVGGVPKPTHSRGRARRPRPAGGSESRQPAAGRRLLKLLEI